MCTTEDPPSRGVLDAGYARDRGARPEVAFRYRVRARVVSGAIERFLPDCRAPRVLDLGCAEGRTLVELDSLVDGGRFVGVELSEELIAKRPALPGSVRIARGDAARLPDSIAPGGFDVVSALALLEHLPDPLSALREAARMLRPGGLFVASCPDPRWDRVATRLGLLADEQHESELDREALLGLVSEAGLEPLAFERFMWAPVAFLPYLRIRIRPDAALRVDRLVRRLRVFDRLFVNQAVIARKPPVKGAVG